MQTRNVPPSARPDGRVNAQTSVQIRAQIEAVLQLFFETNGQANVKDIDWNEHQHWSTQWYGRFHNDIISASKGYPTQEVFHEPRLEDELIEFGERLGLSRLPERKPTICLSHDVDNLFPTWIFYLKQWVSQRRFMFGSRGFEYLDAFRKILEFDASFLPTGRGPTVFVCMAKAKSRLRDRLKQKLFDPAYDETDREFSVLLDLLKRFDCEVGIHGSILSLEDPVSFPEEKKRLEQLLGKPVRLSREHWLHLPQPMRSFSVMHSSGIEMDSTLGWNGRPGFRCGMARPFPILLDSGQWLWEMPLLLMDRPLYDGLRLDTSRVVATCREVLERVFERKGCVSINWHEAAGHRDFPWFEAYEQILPWARDKGFAFTNLSGGKKMYVEKE